MSLAEASPAGEISVIETERRWRQEGLLIERTQRESGQAAGDDDQERQGDGVADDLIFSHGSLRG